MKYLIYTVIDKNWTNVKNKLGKNAREHMYVFFSV